MALFLIPIPADVERGNTLQLIRTWNSLISSLLAVSLFDDMLGVGYREFR